MKAPETILKPGRVFTIWKAGRSTSPVALTAPATSLELGARYDWTETVADPNKANTDLYYAYHGVRDTSRSDAEPSLSARGRRQLAALTMLHLKTARAYQIRLAFQEIYQQPTRGWGALFLDRWYAWAIRSRLEPIKHAARSIKRHREGILAWFDSHIANGLIEGINSLVQAAKAKARGYRSTRTLKAITYLIAGKLDLRLPT